MNVLFRVLFVRSAYLLCGLATLAIVAHFIPTSGTLVVGVLVASSIELTRNRYRENTLSITLIMFSTIALLWGWLGPYLGAFARPAALLMFLVWGAYCLNTPTFAVKRIGLTTSGVVLFLSFVITILNSHHIVGYLLWGYDNSAHVPALSQVYRHSGFLYSGSIPELFTFSNFEFLCVYNLQNRRGRLVQWKNTCFVIFSPRGLRFDPRRGSFFSGAIK